MDPYYLFKLPALTLIIGLLAIDGFISKTNANIARERRKELLKKQPRKLVERVTEDQAIKKFRFYDEENSR